MRIALLGGTGNLGKGLALRLAKLGYEIIIGSRKLEKAKSKASEYLNEVGDAKIYGLENVYAAEKCDIAIFTIPWQHAFSTAETLRDILEDKIVVSPLVPMKRVNGVFIYVRPKEGSAAEKLASILTKSRVVAAYHSIPANRFAKVDERFEWDVPICGDDEEAKKTVIEITNKIEGLRALDAGPLSNSYLVESLTPLILNLMIKNRLGELGVKFV